MKIIEFTDRAVEAVMMYKEVLKVNSDHALRIGIRQKNETNKRLLIGFDMKADQDKETEIAGIKIIYSPGEIFFFAGMKIDYVEEEGRKGFTFVENKPGTF